MNKKIYAILALFITGFFIYGVTPNLSSFVNITSSNRKATTHKTINNTEQSAVKSDSLDNIDLVDHHTHIFTPKVREYLINNVDDLSSLPPLGLKQLLKTLKQDSLYKAAVLSNAYFFSQAGSTSSEDFNTLQSENNRVAEAVSQYPKKLRGFFGINPLSDSAFVEIERNAAKKVFSGIKLHLANSGVNLRNPGHVERLGNVFGKAHSLELGIVIHMRTQESPYGRKDADIFIDSVLSEAPGIPVQIGHMAGWGGYDPETDGALSAFADRAAEDDLRKNIYFDLSAVFRSPRDNGKSQIPKWYPEKRYERLATQLRKIGIGRILFGTDWPEWTPQDYKSDITDKLPLTNSELRQILGNRAPWF